MAIHAQTTLGRVAVKVCFESPNRINSNDVWQFMWDFGINSNQMTNSKRNGFAEKCYQHLAWYKKNDKEKRNEQNSKKKSFCWPFGCR